MSLGCYSRGGVMRALNEIRADLTALEAERAAIAQEMADYHRTRNRYWPRDSLNRFAALSARAAQLEQDEVWARLALQRAHSN